MSEFWPDIDLSDNETPLEILKQAKKDWEVQSGGIITLVLQETISTNDHPLIVVHAKHVPSNRTTTILSVVSREDAVYPTRIQPKTDDLPDAFKKSYYSPGISAALGQEGKTVKNEWVCDTPSEFRWKLKTLFQKGETKSEIISLVTRSYDHDNVSDTDTEDEEDLTSSD